LSAAAVAPFKEAGILAESGALRLIVPHCAPGIGDVILSPKSAHLIEDVKIEPYALWPDDRGYFLEVQRLGAGLTEKFPANSTQVSAALSYPGTTKAFHYHLHQTDCWVPTMGMFQIVLIDFRKDSPTLGKKNTIYAGALRPWRLTIPPGVGHGYKVIGSDPGLLVYLTDRFYNPEDEGRVAYNDPKLAYDWEVQHK
jgi:dTDP-4-dehydrorhamnose 3,5-epimerase